MLMKYCPLCRAELVNDPKGPQTCPACGFTNWDNPAPVATALLLKQGKVVLVKANTRDNRWGLPSGFIEKEENAEQGLIREVKEETNLEARIVGWLGTYPIYNGRKRILLIAYEAVADGVSAAGDEITEIEEQEPEAALRLLEGEEERRIVASWIEKNRNHIKQ
jgi:NAD+ diphosphatase